MRELGKRRLAVNRRTLARFAGTVWLGAGLALVLVASWWFSHATGRALPWVVAGVMGGVLVHRFKLRRLATANLERIDALTPDQREVGVWQFQSRRSYLVIALMVALGYTLRHSPIPRIYLAPVYLAMGTGLLLAGTRYFRSP